MSSPTNVPAAPTPPPSTVRREFKVIATNQAEEDAYDFMHHRTNIRFTGNIGSVAHIVKGALGGGILGGHVAYMKGGFMVATFLTFFFGSYMGYCLYLLVKAEQILCKRTQIPSMSYPDVGEAAFICSPNKYIKKMAKVVRILIDTVICAELFGACACYQLIISKSLKQLIENTQESSIAGKDGLPSLRVYLAVLLIPIILICWITELKWLAPFSVIANFIVLFCIGTSIYYAMEFNPRFENMVPYTTIHSSFQFVGMNVFSMSCVGVVIPVENNMKNPIMFPQVLFIAVGLIIICTFSISFFGYVAFLDKSEAPITVNYPMAAFPKFIKGLIMVMIYFTHALNFWVPFEVVYFYIRNRFGGKMIIQLFFRTILVILIGIVAIVFPNISALMGFLGTFCLTNLAFIWPNVIYLIVVWDRPGLGKHKWRLWRALILITLGLFIFTCGTMVNFMVLVNVFKELFTGESE